MIMSILLLVPQQATSADQVLDRFAATRKVPFSFEAKIKYSRDNLVAQTELKVDRTERTLFKAVTGPYNYIISLTPENGIIELDAKSKSYDEYEYLGAFNLPASRISPLDESYPAWIGRKDLRGAIPASSKFALAEPQTINGFPSDVVKAQYRTDRGLQVELSIAVDRAGTVTQVKEVTTGQGGSSTRMWTLEDYRLRSSIPASEFILEIPVGYTPYALEIPMPRVSTGGKFPMEGWTDSNGKKASLSDISRGKTMLVAILDNEGPSNRALDSLRQLQKTYPTAIIFAGEGKIPSGYLGGEALDKQVRPTATPFFALIQADGTIVQMWMGFDPDQAKAFVQEVIDAGAG